MKEQIKAFAQEREIPYLLHFTRTANLASIMQHGIVPVAHCGFKGIKPHVNDTGRFDYQTGANCLSIGFPNHRMFFKYRKENEAVDWAVLAIEPKVLWTKDCAFCQRNAADGLVSGIPINQRKTLPAFSAMYQEIDGERSRTEQKLKLYDPTHDQAEVLVFDVIEPELIGGVVFSSARAIAEFGGMFDGRQVFEHPSRKGVFAARSFEREY